LRQDISRRSALRNLGRAAALAALPLAAPRRLPASVYGRKKVAALAIGGDRYHNMDYIRTALAKTLGKDLGLSLDFSDEVTLLATRYLKDYKLLIVFRDGMNWPNGYSSMGGGRNSRMVSEPPVPGMEEKADYWITAAQGKSVKDFVQAGGGALFYHNSTYISPHNRDFRDVLGAVTLEHPPLRPFKVKIVNHDHPITRGVGDFVVTDEQHFEKFEKDPKYVLMQSVNEDGLTWRDQGTTSVAGWAYDYGKGRVCYLAPGHTITALWNPEYEKIQKNAARWLLREI
jgi:type 1 glutamine amidotransferase